MTNSTDKTVAEDNNAAALMATPVASNQLWLVNSKPTTGSNTEPSDNLLKDMTDFTDSLSGIIWPLILIGIIIWQRKQLNMATDAIVKRLQNQSTTVKIGPLELISDLESKVKSLQEKNEVISSICSASSSSGELNTIDTVSQELRNLAKAYREVNIEDRGERIRQKVELAGKMANIVNRNGISRESLAKDQDEGIKMALATAIQGNPQPKDGEWICIAAPNIELKNVRYRFMMAIEELITRRLITPQIAIEFKTICKAYKINADDSLNDRIDRTEAILNSFLTE